MDSNRYLKAFNIEWDVDFAEDLESLPTEVQIPAGMTDTEEISDYLSNLTGFCHKGFELRMAHRYQVKLCYGYEQNEDGSIFHAFEAIGPDESPVDLSIDKKLCDVLEADKDNFDWDWLFLALPDSIVSKIRSDAVEELSTTQTVTNQEVAPRYDHDEKPDERMTDNQFNKGLALLQDVGFSWEQSMAIMNIILESHNFEDAVAEVAAAFETNQ